MLVRGYFVTLSSFEPPLPAGECASCGAPAQKQVRVARHLTAPYCLECAKRTRFMFRFFVTSLVIVAVGLLIVVAPIYIAAVPLGVAFFAPPILLGVTALAYGIRRETRALEGGATTQQDAVRLLRPSPAWFFCSNQRFMERLVEAHGGTVVPGTQRQWDVAWSAISAAGAFLGMTWLVLVVGHNGAIMIDNGARANLSIWLDGRRVADVRGGDHEKIHIRPGPHTLAWSTGDKPEHERTITLDALHDYLYNPGATTCYWRSVQIYEKRGPSHDERPELADDGPLVIDELYDFRHVDRWFETNPGSKSISKSDSYTTDYAIIRDERCTALITRSCSKSVLDDLVACESKAHTGPEVNGCMTDAQEACASSP